MYTRYLILSGLLCSGCAQTPESISDQSSIQKIRLNKSDKRGFLRKSVVRSGALKGAVRLAPGEWVNWYFANLGLMAFAKTDAQLVKNHLDAYLRNVVYQPDQYGRAYIWDYSAKLEKVKPDSHDAYASTFLSLVRTYVEQNNDIKWLHKHKKEILEIAYYNLALRAKPSGMITTFQTAASGQYWKVSYTMDNSENYRGLSDLVWMLKKLKDYKTAAYYDLVKRGVAKGLFDPVHGNWNAKKKAFFVSDEREPLKGRFYPDAVAQIWPQFYQVSSGNQAQDTLHFLQARSYLEAIAPLWDVHLYDGRYPWMVLGAAYSQMGFTDRARKQKRLFRKRLSNGQVKLMIHDLGFDQAIR